MADMSVMQNPFGTMPTSPLLGVNPMQGALTGMGIPFTQESGQNVLQSQGIQNMSDLDKLKMRMESEDPAARAENSLKQNTADANNNPELLAQLVSQKIIGSQAAQMDSQGNMLAHKADFIYKLGNEIDERNKSGKAYDPLNEKSKKWWDEKVKEAKKFDFDLPAAPDRRPDGGSDTFRTILAKRDGLQRDPKFWAKMEELKSTQESAAAIHGASNASAERVAGIRERGTEYTADQRLAGVREGIVGRVQANLDPAKAILLDIQAGKEVNPITARWAAEQFVDVELAKTPEGMNMLVESSKGAPSYKAAKDKLVDEKLKLFMGKKIDPNQEQQKSAAPAAAPTTYVKGTKATDKNGKVWEYKGVGDPKDQTNWTSQ